MSTRPNIPEDTLCPRGSYQFLHCAKDGSVKTKIENHNALTTYAKNILLNGMLKGGPPVPPLYFGFFTTPTVGANEVNFDINDTGASHPGWTEFTDYVSGVSTTLALSEYYLDHPAYGRLGGTGKPFVPFGDNPDGGLSAQLQANWNARKIHARPQLLGVPHMTLSYRSAAFSPWFIDQTVHFNQNFGLVGLTEDLEEQGDDPFLYQIGVTNGWSNYPLIGGWSGRIVNDRECLPLYQATGSGLICGGFLGTSPDFNSTTENYFSFCYFEGGMGTVEPGDWMQMSYDLYLRYGGLTLATEVAPS